MIYFIIYASVALIIVGILIIINSLKTEKEINDIIENMKKELN